MYKKTFLVIILISAAACAFAQPQADPDGLEAAAEPPLAMETRLADIDSLEPVRASDRVLILAPHPDDETIACAGIIQEALRAGADTHVLYLTNGDNNEFAFIVYEKRIPVLPSALVHLGEVRRSEAIKAMKLLGLDEYNLIFLGYPDFGTLHIFKDFWQEGKPYKSMLTRATSVPYKNDLSFGSPYTGESILKDLKNTLLRYRPNKIFVSHPADLNRDHKAFYLFLQVALADLAGELPPPKVYCYLVHWKAWPLPRHYHPELPLLPPAEFQSPRSRIAWFKHRLSGRDIENKHKAILAYKSQTESSAFYLLSFGRENELFSVYPGIYLDLLPDPAVKKPASWKDRLVSFLESAGVIPEDSLDSPAENLQGNCPVVYESEGDSLLIRVYKRKDIERTLKTVIYLFGYSRKTPFARMPKIFIATKYNRFKILDGRRVISGQGVSLEVAPEEMVMKIPFSLLGDPDFILASVRGNAGISCADTLSFRKINIRRGQDGRI